MKLKSIREAKGISQYRLAKMSGVTQTYISKIECKNQTSAGYTVLKKLATALECTTEELMGETA